MSASHLQDVAYAPDGNSVRTSRSTPQARAATPTRPSSRQVSRETRPAFSNLALTEGVSTAGRPRPRHPCRRVHPPSELLERVLIYSDSRPAGANSRLPKRLPQRSAVMFSKSPRIRPQKLAVGRYPTSLARAPRSPVWLASRSSSSAIARMPLRLRGRLRTRQSFDSLAIGGCVADRRIAGQGLHVMDRPGAGPPASARSMPRCWYPREISR